MMLILVAVIDRDVLGQDRDAALALQVVGVEDALALQLRWRGTGRLANHRVDQRRLAVVNVGDDGHVADIVTSDHGVFVRQSSGGPFELRKPRGG